MTNPDTTSVLATRVAPKNGFATTEFWLVLVAHILNALVLAGVFPTDGPWVKLAAVIGSSISQVIYTSGRNTLKSQVATVLMIFTVGMIFAGGFLPGCAEQETNRVAQSIVATEGQAKTIDWLYTSGKIDKATAQQLTLLLKDERAAEDAYYDAILAHNSDAMKLEKAAWAAGVDRLASELAKYPPLPSASAATLPAPATQSH